LVIGRRPPARRLLTKPAACRVAFGDVENERGHSFDDDVASVHSARGVGPLAGPDQGCVTVWTITSFLGRSAHALHEPGLWIDAASRRLLGAVMARCP